MATLQYKTVLANLNPGEKARYRAVVMTNGSVGLANLATSIHQKTGLETTVVKYICELFLKEIAKRLENGTRVEIEDLFSGYLSINGLFDAQNSPWDKSKHRVVPHFSAKGSMRKVFEGVEATNVTQGNHVTIRRVLDTVLKVNGKIMSGENVTVYISGLNLAVDPAQEDEGCWLEKDDGTIVARSEVTGSTQTTLDCRFATVPAPGVYNIVVASRGGLGPEFGVSIARRSVEVVEA